MGAVPPVESRGRAPGQRAPGGLSSPRSKGLEAVSRGSRGRALGQEVPSEAEIFSLHKYLTFVRHEVQKTQFSKLSESVSVSHIVSY